MHRPEDKLPPWVTPKMTPVNQNDSVQTCDDWIAVTDSVPPDIDHYIVWIDYVGSLGRTQFSDMQYWNGANWPGPYVTHWMPRPHRPPQPQSQPDGK